MMDYHHITPIEARGEFKPAGNQPWVNRQNGPTNNNTYRTGFRGGFQNTNTMAPPRDSNNRSNFEAVTGYTVPFRRVGEEKDNRPTGMVSTPIPPQRGPAKGNNSEIDRLREELANMKLMYERDNGQRPPGPPACRLCREVGHFARNCPYQPTVHCIDMESERDQGESSDSDTSENAETAEAYAAEKRGRDFQVQTTTRKRVAFDTEAIDKPGKRLSSPPPRKDAKSPFNYQAAIGGPSKHTGVPASKNVTNTKTPHGNTTEQFRNQTPKPQPSQANTTHYHSTASTGLTDRKDYVQKAGHAETKRETLVKIATDYLKNKVVLDPLKHKDVSMKEVNTTIAEHLMQGGRVQTKSIDHEPRIRTLPGNLTARPNQGTKHAGPIVAAIESDSGSESDAGLPEDDYQEMPALESMDSDEEVTDSDHSSSEDSSSEESEDEGITVPSFRLINKTKIPAKPGRRWIFAPTPKHRKCRCRPVLPKYTSLRTTSYIGQYHLETIVDSGSSHSFINKHTAKEMGLGRLIRKNHVSFTNADGTRSLCKGVIRAVALRIGPLQAKMDLFVSKGGKYDILLGSDFLAPIRADIKYGRQQVRFKIGRGKDAIKGAIKVNFKGPEQNSCMMVVEPTPSSAYDGFQTQGSSTGLSLAGLNVGADPSMPALEECSDMDSEYGAVDTKHDFADQASDEASDVECDVEQYIEEQGSNELMSDFWEEFEEPQDEYQKLAQQVEENDPWMFDMAPTLPMKHFAPIVDLLDRYRHIFAADDSQLTQTDLVKHHIELLPGTQPIAQRPYRLSYREREVVHQEVQKMLAAGIIRPSKSPWASPVVLVGKKDGGVRFTTDFTMEAKRSHQNGSNATPKHYQHPRGPWKSKMVHQN